MEQKTPKRILVVEDEVIIALSEKKTLEKYGYTVLTVHTGEKAVETVAEGAAIDLILMDIDLGPGMDGTQTAECILKDYDLPIVFLSSHTEPEIVEKTEKITSYGYVVKNSSNTVLDASIKMAFKLFDSEKKQHTMISNISDVIVIIDLDGINRYKSPNVRKWFGWNPEELIGQCTWDNIHPDDLESAKAMFEGLLATPGASGSSENRYRCKDGSYKWVEITFMNLVQNPVIRGILGNYHDISARKRVEQEKAFERLFTEKLLDSLPGIFYLYTYPELRLARWNKNHETLLGYGPGEIAGRHIMDWHIPESKETLQKAVTMVMEKGRGSLEIQLVRKDGGTVPFLLTGTRFEAEGKKYLMGIGIDLTERRKAEAELLESQDRLSALFSAMTEMVALHEVVLDPSGKAVDYRILDCNPAYTAITGIRREDAVGRLASEVYQSDAAPYLDVFTRVGITGKSEEFSTYFEPMRKYFSISVVPYKKNRFETITTDITAKREIERELQEKIEELDRYFNLSLDLLCIADLDGRFVRLNPEWESILGYSVGELLGKPFLNYVHPDDQESTRAALSDLGENKRVLNFENRYRHKDGSYRWIEWRSHPQGGLIYAVARDVTERKLAEEELKKQVAEKEILLKEVHHRIKNNIASIEALLSMQAQSVKNPEARLALNDAMGRLGSMRILYEKILVSGSYEESSVGNFLGSLIDSVAALFPNNPSVVIEKRIDDFNLAARSLFPLGIVVAELLTNVLKYAFAGREGGKVTISLEREGGSVTLAVRDDGKGLPPGFRLDKTTGFGLMLVGMLAEQLKGSFFMESDRGTKSILRFSI